MMKQIQLQPSKLGDNRYHISGFARRVLLLFTFIVACVGSMWGQSEPKVQEIITLYKAAGESDAEANFYEYVISKFADLGFSLTQDNCFTRWDVVQDGNYVVLNHDWAAPNSIFLKHNNSHYLFSENYSGDNKMQYGYSVPTKNPLPLEDNLNAQLQFGS